MKIFDTITISISLFISTVSAQRTYTIDPDSVPIATRNAWCESEIAQCPSICLQTSAHSSITKTNQCSAETLTYSCVCSNGLSPNVSEYSLTIPYYICQEWGNQCVTACGSDNSCSAACRNDHPCGAQNPTRVNTTTTTTTGGGHAATASSSGGPVTGFADGTHSNGVGRMRPPFGFTTTEDEMAKVVTAVGLGFLTLLGFFIGL